MAAEDDHELSTDSTEYSTRVGTKGEIEKSNPLSTCLLVPTLLNGHGPQRGVTMICPSHVCLDPGYLLRLFLIKDPS